MKTAFILSDVHIDFLYKTNAKTHTYEEFAPLAEDWLQTLDLPKTDCLLIAGDIANDFETFTHFCKFISGKYEKTYMVLGNHDLTVRGATESTSNLPFKTSFEKIEAQKAEVKKYDNVFLLDGDVLNGIGGTIGMCDFEYRPSLSLNYIGMWKMHWYDGRTWRLGDKGPLDFWRDEREKMLKIIEQQPKVMMTHFIPVELGCSPEYKYSNTSCFFFFNAEEFLEKMPNDSYWICGHTHDIKKKDYICKNGNVVHIICNPFGYNDSECNWTPVHSGFKKEDFIIQLKE